MNIFAWKTIDIHFIDHFYKILKTLYATLLLYTYFPLHLVVVSNGYLQILFSVTFWRKGNKLSTEWYLQFLLSSVISGKKFILW